MDRAGSRFFVVWVALFFVGISAGCLASDDDGGGGEDLAADTAEDAGGRDIVVDEPDLAPPQDTGSPDLGSDPDTSTGLDLSMGEDVGTADDPDTGPVDPLACELVDWGYGPVWDGTVSSQSIGSEPSPMTGITEAHNAVRRFVGVPELSWSTTLAASSQTWANHLAESLDCGLQHDPDNDYGENLYSAMSTGALSVTPQDVVGGWSCEREDWDNDAMTCNGISGFGQSPRSCGHYTQVVWDDTTQVGCAIATCTLSSYNAMVWVCRYSPPGNWVGERPY